MSSSFTISKKESGELTRYFSQQHWTAKHAIGPNDHVHHVIFTHKDLKVDVTPKSVTFSKELRPIVLGIVQTKQLYKSLTGTEKFLGETPDPLSKQAYDRGVLTRFNYSVTNTDEKRSERFLFYINKYGVPSFVSTKLEYDVFPGMQPITRLADTILDGEFTNGTFYATDIIFAKGKDVREKKLHDRLDMLFDVLMILKIQFFRMRTYFVVTGDSVKEYPEKKQTKFTNIYEASKHVLEKHKSGLLFTPVDPEHSSFVWKSSSSFKTNSSPNIFFIDSLSSIPNKKVEDVRLKIDLKNFFESRETFEKLLVSLHKHILPGGIFKGFIRKSLSSSSGKLLLGSNFSKFVQVMEKWGFDLVEKSDPGGGDFVFKRKIS